MTPTSSNILEPYNGSDPYVFVSYSHKDKDQVLPIIEFIQKQGFKVWYDKGLRTGAKWRETIDERIEHCAMFLICLSPHCEFNEAGTPSMIRNEIYLAIEEHKEHIYPIMLEDFKLPPGIKGTLIPYEKLLKYKMTDDEFFEQLNGEIASIIPASIQKSKSVKIDDEEYVDYHGQKLVKSEYDAIAEIEKRTGAIPMVSEIKENTFGIIIIENHVFVIGLREKGLTVLPVNIGNLTHLQKLNLHGNDLTSVPESIGNLTSLKELDLEGNKLTSVPESIGNLTSLQKLELNYNELTSVPESIGNLTSLQKLYLEGNKLTSVPESITKLTSLQQLTLYRNKLPSPQPEKMKTIIKQLRSRGCDVSVS